MPSGQKDGLVQEGRLQRNKLDAGKVFNLFRGDLALTVVLQNSRHTGGDFQQDNFRHNDPGPESQTGFQQLIGLRVMDIASDEGRHPPRWRR